VEAETGDWQGGKKKEEGVAVDGQHFLRKELFAETD